MQRPFHARHVNPIAPVAWTVERGSELAGGCVADLQQEALDLFMGDGRMDAAALRRRHYVTTPAMASHPALHGRFANREPLTDGRVALVTFLVREDYAKSQFDGMGLGHALPDQNPILSARTWISSTEHWG